MVDQTLGKAVHQTVDEMVNQTVGKNDTVQIKGPPSLRLFVFVLNLFIVQTRDLIG